MLGIHPRRLAGVGLSCHDRVPPLVAAGGHLYRRTGTLEDDHVPDALAATERDALVHDRLEGDFLTAAELAVGANDGNRARVDDAFLQRLRREPAEHHGVRRAYPGERLHRHHRLDRHRHVDDDPVAGLDPHALQAVGEPADLVIQRLVSDLRDLAVIGFEDDRNLVGLGLEVTVEAVVGSVQFAVVEPLVERRVRLVERLGERLRP